MLYNHYIFGDFIKDSEPLSLNELDDIFIRADRHLGKIQEVPIDKIVEILDLLSEKWLDPDYHFRKIAIDKMPAVVGYSPQMVEAAINVLFESLKMENLYRLLRGHISKPSLLDKFEYYSPYEGYLKAQPLGVVLHVSTDSFFVNGISSLIHGFLSKNINLLKIESGDPLFPFLFARSLQDVDEGGYIAGSFSILQISDNGGQIESAVTKRCDGVVVYGADEVIRGYREKLPTGTRLIEHCPKFSFAIVTGNGFELHDPGQVFERCAKDVIMWEQRDHSSPHVIYVEESIAKKFLEGFPRYLELADHEFPQMNLNFNEKTEVLKVREMARMEEAEGTAMLFHSPRSMRWTVIYEDSPVFKISPGNRTVYIKPFRSWADVLGQTVKIKNYLHTAGLVATESQIKMLSKALARLGVSRITEVGTMHMSKPASPQDFDFPLTKLIKWVNIEWVDKRFDLGDVIAPSKPTISRWEYLNNIAGYAKNHSVFYGKYLKSVEKIDDYEDFVKVPLLTGKHILENTLPEDNNLLTAPINKAYVFDGGRSEDKPLFSYYSFWEIDQISSILADIYLLAGITKQDSVACLFSSGTSIDSFMVVNSALEKIGCSILPFNGNTDLPLILRYMGLFKPNIVLGRSSTIIHLVKEIRHRGLNLKFDKILYSGRRLTAETSDFLKEASGAEFIGFAGYSSAIAGPVGYQCKYCSEGIHHLLYEYVFLEIIDPDSGKPLDYGSTGEIVVTDFHRRLMPIIRYRTGAIGRMLPHTCRCGHPTPLFEVMEKDRI